MDVDRARLRADIEAVAEFGAIEAAQAASGGRDPRGRTNLTGTAPNRLAREYLLDRLEDAGLAVVVDAVGNIAGTWYPPDVDRDAPPVGAGSHLDSVPSGGIFDGPLGVFAALEAVRAMQAGGVEPARPIAVVSFTEEEGARFGGGLLGSSVAAGATSVEDALAHTDDEGVTLESALADIGFRGEGRLDASEWDGWLELHVEQDTRLETAGVPVGVVTTITGIIQGAVSVDGTADHAGTTPMDRRTDALAGASEFVLDVERAAYDAVADEPSAVGTVGRCEVTPNARNVVPGRVEMGLDVRAADHDVMGAIVHAARESLERLAGSRGLETELDVLLDLEPTPMSRRCREALGVGANRAGVDTLALHSGAAHDSMHVASVTDAGMAFAPSRDGVSHSPLEWTDWADCETATAVLAGALEELSGT